MNTNKWESAQWGPGSNYIASKTKTTNYQSESNYQNSPG